MTIVYDQGPSNIPENETGSLEETYDENYEPKLKFKWIKKNVKDVVARDTITCIATHSSFFALGTKSGKVHIFDHFGNFVFNRTSENLHSSEIIQLNIDNKGEVVLSCSRDKVVLRGIHDNVHDHVFRSNRPLYSAAIDPYFCEKGSKGRIVTGSEEIILYEKSFLLKFFYVSKKLFDSYDKVKNIKWRGNYIACASDTAIRFFDLEQGVVFCCIKKEDEETVPGLYPSDNPCCLFWRSDEQILIGWSNSIRIGNVGLKPPAEIKNSSPIRRVVLTRFCTIESFIDGIASLGDQLIVLVRDLNNSNITPTSPQVLIIEVGQHMSEILSKDFLEDYKDNCRYFLEYLPGKNLYFIVSPKSVMLGEPPRADDRVSWLVSHNNYVKALNLVRSDHSIVQHSILSVGKAYIRYLLTKGDHASCKKAASLCSSIASNKFSWQKLYEEFKCTRKLHYLGNVLPISKEICFEPYVYQTILKELLKHDADCFSEMIKKLPPDFYDVEDIFKSLANILKDEYNSEPLLKAFVHICILRKEYDNAISVLLKMKQSKEVFDLINQHNLVNFTMSNIKLLMDLDSRITCKILVSNTSSMPIQTVIEKLKDDSKWLWTYLDSLIETNSELCAEYHNELVLMYISHSPSKLLNFLQKSRHYSSEDALSYCKQYKRYVECVFLCSKMGKNIEAIDILVDQESNIDLAIKFCKDKCDVELWKYLIEKSKDKPIYLSKLLATIDVFDCDPMLIIEKIKDKHEIPDFKQSMLNLLNDCNTKIMLEKCSLNLLNDNCFEFFKKLVKMKKRGFLIDYNTTCHICKKNIIEDSETMPCSDVICFNCQHIYHKNCLRGERCELCAQSDTKFKCVLDY